MKQPISSPRGALDVFQERDEDVACGPGPIYDRAWSEDISESLLTHRLCVEQFDV